MWPSVVAVASVYGQLGLGVAAVTAEGGDPLDHVLAHLVGHPPEHHVLPIKPVKIVLFEFNSPRPSKGDCTNQGALSVVMKNCEPLESWPLLDMEITKRWCFRTKFSSSKRSP